MRFLLSAFWATLLTLLLGFGGTTFGQNAFQRVGPDLQALVQDGGSGPFEVFILLADRVDAVAIGAAFEAQGMPLESRPGILIPLLQQKATTTQAPVLQLLQQLPGVDQASLESFWITNVIYCQLDATALADLDRLPAVEIVELVPELVPTEATPVPVAPQELLGANGHEYSLEVIRADRMWARGYTGNGTKALIIDTGTDPLHPALRRNFVGQYEARDLGWYGLTEDPYDCDNHGTHVAGTILGLDRYNKDTIGVAPNGRWMASPAIACTNGPGATSALQWAINPDGDLNTTDDMPDVINNSWRFLPSSWGCSYPGQLAINALEAVGVAVVSAAGNDHPDHSVGGPAFANYSLVNSFAVGAVNPNAANFVIAGFSSRGPTECGGTGSLLIKPEVVAPGTGIRSAIRGGGYAVYQGTSMASPHVAGAVLLLKEAFPNLSGTQVKEALYYSAIDLGDPGEDNTYGNGMIDVEAAYQYLIAQGHVPQTVDRTRDGGISILSDEACGLDHSPMIQLENLGTQPIVTATFRRVYSDGLIDTVSWTGNVAVGAAETLALSPRSFAAAGRYEWRVELIGVNGGIDAYALDNWDEGALSVFETVAVTPINANACIGSDAILQVLTDDPEATIHWYDQATGGDLLGTGRYFQTPVITSGKLYHAAVAKRPVLGPAPDPNAGGFFDPGTSESITFDVYYPCQLEAVTVRANTAGNRIIQVRNEQGIVLGSRNVTLDAGQHRVELNFSLPPGKDYRLSLGFATGGLWKQTVGNLALVVPGVLEVTNLDGGMLPYFFAWELSYELPCPRELVFATVSPGTLVADFSASVTDNRQVAFAPSVGNGISYLWQFGDGSSSTAALPQHQYDTPGTYEVSLQITNAAYCSDAITKSVTVAGTTNALAAGDWEEFVLYPNPAYEYIRVAWLGPGTVDLRLYDPMGRMVQAPDQLQRGDGLQQISIADMPAGLYTLIVGINGRVMTRKIVKPL